MLRVRQVGGPVCGCRDKGDGALLIVGMWPATCDVCIGLDLSTHTYDFARGLSAKPRRERVIEIVSATRLPESEFWSKSALGISLSMARPHWQERATAWIAYENRAGLPELYNARIAAKNDHDILVFVHDDVWIDDMSFCERVMEGCNAFDVIGLA
jgi:hypothetical protein